MRRSRISRRGSRRLFTVTALKQNRRNVSTPARGGIRL